MDVCYDLETSPPTFDFVTFLVTCELRRLDLGEERISIHFAPGPRDGHRKTMAWPGEVENCEATMRSIVFPMASLLPSVASLKRHRDRAATEGMFGHGAKVYGLGPQLLAWGDPRSRCLTTSVPRPRRGNRIVVTLREASHHEWRNSRIGEWMRACEWMRSEGFEVIVLRDADKANEPFGDFPTNAAASVDVWHRAMMYESAGLCLFVNNGPMVLASFMGAPLINFRCSDDRHRASSPPVLRSFGWEPGTQPPGAPPHQHWSWKEDTAEAIIEEVKLAYATPSRLAPASR